jgi:ABC-type multidrug transport system fused ATPase/permease subunit
MRDVPASTRTTLNAWRSIFRLRHFLLPHAGAIGLALLLLLGEASMDLLKPWPLKLTFDVILKHQSLAGITLFLLIGVSALAIAIAVLEGLSGYWAAYYLNLAGRTVVFELRAALFNHIQRLSLQFHNRRSTGDLITRVTSDVKVLRDAMTESVAEILKSVVFLIGMGAVLWWLDSPLSLVVLGAAPVLLVALSIASRRIQERSRAERKREGALASVVHETLGTLRMSRVFTQEDEATRKFHVESAASLETGFAATMAGERFSSMVDVLGGVVTAVVLAFGVERVMTHAITPGTLIVFVSYVRSLYKSLKVAAKHATRLTKAGAPVERVAELLDVEEVVTDRPTARPAPPIQGAIEFRGVSFEYEPGNTILADIDLVIPPRRITALVGPTGAGKSTLVSLIPRLLDATRGQVSIDGHDIRDWTLRSLRSQISVVLQESVLLQASVAENIAYGRPAATYEEIEVAARAANAHDFIVALRDGYDTVVGERGETLSGGQRQRIAIARAIVRNAPIVILDEPLTGLDPVAAASVANALERLMTGRTVIVITHQLSSVQRADQVVVLSGGRIAQQGRHRDLMNDAGGLYRQLVQAQFQDLSPVQA